MFNKKLKYRNNEAFWQRGWILVSAVMMFIEALLILALWYNIQPRQQLFPERCTFPVSLDCLDYNVSGTYIAVTLRNHAGRDMNIQRISASSDAMGTSVNLGCSCYVVPASTSPPSNTIRNGQTLSYALNTPDTGCPNWCSYRDTGREKNLYNITVTYNWVDSPPNITHQLSGEMLSRGP